MSFVELRLDCRTITVLSILDQEDLKERDDRGAGVDDQLPRVRVVEYRARQTPNDDRGDTENKRDRASGNPRHEGGKPCEAFSRRSSASDPSWAISLIEAR